MKLNWDYFTFHDPICSSGREFWALINFLGVLDWSSRTVVVSLYSFRNEGLRMVQENSEKQFARVQSFTFNWLLLCNQQNPKAAH